MPAKRKNPNAVKQWFITYPRRDECDTRESFALSFPPANYRYCCEEEHGDEDGLHFHLIIDFKHAIKFKELQKYVEVKYPNANQRIQYRPVRSLEHSLDYTAKVDPSPFIQGTVNKEKKKKIPKWAQEAIAYKQNYIEIMEQIHEEHAEAEAFASECMLWEKLAEDTQERYGDKFDKELFLREHPEPEHKSFFQAKRAKLAEIRKNNKMPYDPTCPF